MKYKLWSGLSTILVLSALSLNSSGHAEQRMADLGEPLNTAVNADEESIARSENGETADAEIAGASEGSDVVKVGEHQSANSQDAIDAIAKITAHQLDQKQAATLYVRDIPVLTFLQKDLASATPERRYNTVSVNENSALKVATPTPEPDPSDPVVRASAVAAQINQLSRNNVDADTIRVRWDAEREAYVIEVGEEKLVAIDSDTILPDTTRNPAEDALQATNRLRRQIGNAKPLNAIEGKPQPEILQTATRAISDRVQGWASWYGPGFHGNLTANGERYNQYAMTAAHRHLPFGTEVRVTNMDNGRSVVVRINDRGPFIGGRIIDLSAGAAEVLGMISSGVAPVQVEILAPAR
ncbi:septal ring lytic transglycosylase RlpA family protein [Lyngbya sp. CCY1209]|uniref:septal ring lytic transglycosylase RlpA family protein n=1 Tax=Lyngbya sp. CCY1209 TaxID=2886103 RepID=UPI002D1FE4BD|nr:septal ring lytic transglycosylase RlpA family protein [Lyngbya sp. CCY1209]MEB3885898.1 septal ring lytic transglycosylase RlpA family protein [Lyngbya sp. CCY1209]